MKNTKTYHTTFTLATRISLILFIFLITACKSDELASPKPRTFPRIDFPEKKFQKYQNENCSFVFEYPLYARVQKDSLFAGEETDNLCWFDVVFPEFNGRIHCSYYSLDAQNQLDSLIYDSFALVGRHNIKAKYIKETPLVLDGGGGGMLFNISGPVASPTQFFVTDSSKHFLRGSLYFYNKVKLDSMRIIHDFVDEDIDHLLQTFYWD